ncbi:MAG: hypothetical protein BWZ02_01106 [Lentisphaerae bacterium ADurb.BinA184]|nr:MAG: hypothetical protein BWZ02_01106 [Lentisphaerae bacterium ADurb.BinA184]
MANETPSGAGGTMRLGISACLLGQAVRYDGGHKYDAFLVETLGPFVEYVPVCPEVECGLGVPREAMRLVGEPAHPRLVTIRSRQDMTGRMEAWARQRVEGLAREGLCGFIFKSKSPSSGMERVKVYNEHGLAAKAGTGIFARIFMERFPELPVEEEGRLCDPVLRENFIERLFAVQRWREGVQGDPRPARLVAFHAAHKLLLMAHQPRAVSELGRLVAAGDGRTCAATVAAYGRRFFEVLAVPATVRRHVNVLEHAMGYFKKELTADEKQELLDVIGAYHRGLLPLIVPVTLLAHYVRKFRQEYLGAQVYFRPHPAELRLRNHV